MKRTINISVLVMIMASNERKILKSLIGPPYYSIGMKIIPGYYWWRKVYSTDNYEVEEMTSRKKKNERTKWENGQERKWMNEIMNEDQWLIQWWNNRTDVIWMMDKSLVILHNGVWIMAKGLRPFLGHWPWLLMIEENEIQCIIQ